MQLERPALLRYAGAAIAVAIATAIRLALDPILGVYSPYLPFVFAVIVVARYAGRGPGLAATFLSGLSCLYFFIEPRYSFAVQNSAAIPALLLFLVVAALISLMIGALREALFSSVQSEARFRALFESMAEGFASCQMIFDSRGEAVDFRYLAVNSAFASLTGLPVEQVVGRRVRELLPDIEPIWIETYGRVVRTGESERICDRVRSIDKYLEVVVWRSGPGRFAVVFNDVTERMRAAEEADRLNVELERRVRERTAELEVSNKELEAFAYSVSHDLRAPLRGIDGWSLALAEDYADRLDARAHEYLGRVRSETQRMGLLIDDLLELSRVTRAELQPQPVDLTALAQRIAAQLLDAHPGRTIDFEIASGLKADGDPRLIEVALRNLLDNAVKFTGQQAQAHIQVGRGAGHGAPAFFVRDNGVGFDMAYAATLFDAFQRLHKTSEFPGTGIGLATVQRIVMRHGGRIWTEAQPGLGATFHFTLGADGAVQSSSLPR